MRIKILQVEEAWNKGPKGGAGLASVERERGLMQPQRGWEGGSEIKTKSSIQSIGCGMCTEANTLIIFSFRGTMGTVMDLPGLTVLLYFKMYHKERWVCHVDQFSPYSMSLAKLICVSFSNLPGYTVFQIRQMVFEKSERARMLKTHQHVSQYLRGHRCLKAKGGRIGPR